MSILLGKTARWLVLVTLMIPAASTLAVSQIDTFEFADEIEQRRYRALIEEFRCPKCLNTNLAGSDAPIAQDLRKTVYRLVVIEAMSDQQVRDYLQTRYGDFVLYDPPFNARTWYIWLVPIALALLALLVLLRMQRAGQRAATLLDAGQRAKLQNIMAESAGDPVQGSDR
ncbi:MAG: cytochrome c-type biogenesis protein CcmH [Gammaproteobacteria bacterium]|nr:cytochrome c-type biogenesis protein CcmH [Gammaproteobacteria bacterium]